jgi:hypothetical protein
MSLKEAALLRMARIRQDLAHSPIRDLRQMLDLHGRLFLTDSAPLQPHLAPPLPTLPEGTVDVWNKAVDLSDIFRERGVTVVALNMSKVGAEHIRAYKNIASGHAPVIDIHVIVGRIKGLLFGRKCRRELQQSPLVNYAHDKTVCLVSAKPGLFGGVGAWNRYGGYVYLVDQKGRARWRASGPPTDSDLDNYQKALEILSAEKPKTVTDACC